MDSPFSTNIPCASMHTRPAGAHAWCTPPPPFPSPPHPLRQCLTPRSLASNLTSQWANNSCVRYLWGFDRSFRSSHRPNLAHSLTHLSIHAKFANETVQLKAKDKGEHEVVLYLCQKGFIRSSPFATIKVPGPIKSNRRISVCQNPTSLPCSHALFHSAKEKEESQGERLRIRSVPPALHFPS